MNPYGRESEFPESCPVCGKPNQTDDGKDVCSDAVGFCSTACMKEYVEHWNKVADELLGQLSEEDRLVAEHNAKCPQCKGSKKLCRHQL